MLVASMPKGTPRSGPDLIVTNSTNPYDYARIKHEKPSTRIIHSFELGMTLPNARENSLYYEAERWRSVAGVKLSSIMRMGRRQWMLDDSSTLDYALSLIEITIGGGNYTTPPELEYCDAVLIDSTAWSYPERVELGAPAGPAIYDWARARWSVFMRGYFTVPDPRVQIWANSWGFGDSPLYGYAAGYKGENFWNSAPSRMGTGTNRLWAYMRGALAYVRDSANAAGGFIFGYMPREQPTVANAAQTSELLAALTCYRVLYEVGKRAGVRVYWMSNGTHAWPGAGGIENPDQETFLWGIRRARNLAEMDVRSVSEATLALFTDAAVYGVRVDGDVIEAVRKAVKK